MAIPMDLPFVPTFFNLHIDKTTYVLSEFRRPVIFNLHPRSENFSKYSANPLSPLGEKKNTAPLHREHVHLLAGI